MRATILTVAPLLAVLGALPASAQVSARLHVDIPIGRRTAIAYAAPRHQLAVREYDRRLFGAWENNFDEWIPETVYLYDGDYYDYPIVEYAQPIVVYRYRNDIFFAPRQREFVQWREQRGYRDFGRSYRPIPRDFRDDRRYQAPRETGRDQYRSAPQDRGNGREVRPAPQGGRDDRGARSQSGRGTPPVRGGDRSRPEQHH